MNIRILYEDNHLLVVEKPVNIPVQEDSSGDTDVITLVKHDLKVRYQKPGNVFLALIHRLDRPVGGALLLAKTSKAASRLANMFRQKEVERKYLAVTRGAPNKKSAVLEHYLVKDQRENKVFLASKQNKKAKKAVLEYELKEKNADLSLLLVRLHTGRSHQIRVQLAAEGCPLYGDQKYGQTVNSPGQQIALWSSTLEFKHPVRKEIITVRSYPPKQFPWEVFKEKVTLL